MTSLPVNTEHPTFRFLPDRDFLWSRGWNFSIQVVKHSNNYGFLNDQDYSNNESDVLFILDGMRPHLYSDGGLKKAQGSYFDLMRQFFIDQAATRGYKTIDMHPVFHENYRKDGVRFEFPTDGHWNALGHSLVAKAIASSLVFKRTFQSKN